MCNALAAWAGPTALRSLTVRFTANVFDGDEVVAGGVVTAVAARRRRHLATCDVWLDRADGTRAVEGRAVVAFEEEDHDDRRIAKNAMLRIEDRLAIGELVSTYGILLDNREYDAVGELFTEDARFWHHVGDTDVRTRRRHRRLLPRPTRPQSGRRTTTTTAMS